MTRRALLLALVGVPLVRPVDAAGFHVTGVLGGPDTEGGYFELVSPESGASQRELILATPIRSPLYPNLKALEGKRVQISVTPV